MRHPTHDDSVCQTPGMFNCDEITKARRDPRHHEGWCTGRPLAIRLPDPKQHRDGRIDMGRIGIAPTHRQGQISTSSQQVKQRDGKRLTSRTNTAQPPRQRFPRYHPDIGDGRRHGLRLLQGDPGYPGTEVRFQYIPFLLTFSLTPPPASWPARRCGPASI